MDKTAIKNFSIWARNKLIADITYKAGLLGITEEGIKDALPQSTQDAEFYDIGTKEPYAIHGEEIKQRKELISAIRKKASQLEYKEAYRNVIEEVAYTWFNRLIAIRFMEVNDYMPAHIRVLSSESGTKLEPDLVTTPFDAEIEFTQQETEHIIQMKNDNQVDALFRFLFIKQCNALNAYLPKLFEKTSDYTELLLNVSVTDQDGIVYHLTHDIKEDDFNISNIGEDGKPTGQVEIIGWMYQYYNTEPKDEAFALLKSNVKITKERIPAATQLFTPDWIVRYMVENSVGRLWLEGHENEELKKGWKYYLDEAEQKADVEEQLKAIREEYKNIKPEEIKVIDPCMGSGHILVYAFDVLMQIYESYGYSQRDAAKSIVENNIYGLDIDDRAFQLAYFAIMMKARSYNRRFLTLGIEPNLCAIQESNGIQYDKDMGDFLLSEEHRETLQYLLHTFVDAKEYGSILNVEKRDYDGFLKTWEQTAEATLENVVMIGWYNECNRIVPSLAKQAKILSDKYDVVVTNPPYMGASGMNANVSDFVKKYYFDFKFDLFSAFIVKCTMLAKNSGFLGFLTPYVWMFIQAYEKLRNYLCEEKTLETLIQFEYSAFQEATVPICTFCLRNRHLEKKGIYIKLTEYKGGMEIQRKKYLEAKNNHVCGYYYETVANKFSKIPGKPIAFWENDNFINLFNHNLLYDYSISDGQNVTSNNARFVRYFWELDKNKIGIGKKWRLYAKGGGYRKWYGNLIDTVDWSPEAIDFYHHESSARVLPEYLWYKKGITWGLITSSLPSFRVLPEEATFDKGGSSIFLKDEELFEYVIGLLNSKVFLKVVTVLNSTLNFQVKDIRSMPMIFDRVNNIKELVNRAIALSKEDWDSYETSWDFKMHPLLKYKQHSMEKAYLLWDEECRQRFEELKNIETQLNRHFIEIYGLSNELSADVEDKDVTVKLADCQRECRSFVSYCIGCIFGRYSMEQEGILYAGGKLEDSLHILYGIDSDNIIPVTDEEYLEDDIVEKICECIQKAFGENDYEQNIIFLSENLGTTGNMPKDKIRNYVLKEFYRDHVKVYQKCPIYWLFDSGKQNGFKALIYMHRYDADTIGNLRVDYLHRMERIYENEISRMQDMIDNSSNAREVTAASKRKEKLQKQLKECQEYDEKIGHLALSRIEIDLDDGVKVNYDKVQTANDGKKYQVLAKI